MRYFPQSSFKAVVLAFLVTLLAPLRVALGSPDELQGLKELRDKKHALVIQIVKREKKIQSEADELRLLRDAPLSIDPEELLKKEIQLTDDRNALTGLKKERREIEAEILSIARACPECERVKSLAPRIPTSADYLLATLRSVSLGTSGLLANYEATYRAYLEQQNARAQREAICSEQKGDPSSDCLQLRKEHQAELEAHQAYIKSLIDQGCVTHDGFEWLCGDLAAKGAAESTKDAQRASDQKQKLAPAVEGSQPADEVSGKKGGQPR